MGWYRSVPTAKTSIPDYYVTVGGIVPSEIRLEYAFGGNNSINEPIVIGKRVSRARNMFSPSTSFNSSVTILNENMDCSFLFSGASVYNTHFNTPNGTTNCQGMFYGCRNYNQETYIPRNVTSAVQCFSGCSNFNSDVIFNDNRTSGINLYGLFTQCTNLNRVITTPNNVISYLGMFNMCSNYNKIHYINNTTAVVNGIFNGTKVNFNELPYIREGRTNLAGLYSGCRYLNTPINILANSNFNNLSAMFFNCDNLNSNINIYTDNPSNLKSDRIDLSYMFCNCKNFYNANINIANTLLSNNSQDRSMTRIVNMSHMFDGCTNYRTIGPTTLWENSWFNNLKAPYSYQTAGKSLDLSYMFANSALACSFGDYVANKFLSKIINAYPKGMLNVEGLFSNTPNFNVYSNYSYGEIEWLQCVNNLNYTFNGIGKLFIGGVNHNQFITSGNAVNMTYASSMYGTGMCRYFVQTYNTSRDLGYFIQNFSHAFSNTKITIGSSNSTYVNTSGNNLAICLPLTAHVCDDIFDNSTFIGNESYGIGNRIFHFGNARYLRNAFQNTKFLMGPSWSGFGLDVYLHYNSGGDWSLNNIFKNVTGWWYNMADPLNGYRNGAYIRKTIYVRANAWNDFVNRVILTNALLDGEPFNWTNYGGTSYYNDIHNIYIRKWTQS